MLKTARQRLAPRALALKKTWLLASYMGGYRPVGIEAIIEDYSRWSRLDLQKFVNNIESDITDALSPLLVRPKEAIRPDATRWLASRFDEWLASGLGIFTISTAQDFERHVGAVKVRDQIELPPYAEFLLQPGFAMAFRHPEYMLARDLVFLYELFRQAEGFLDNSDRKKHPQWPESSSENSQSLARTVILTCFNLLESFTSGLARGHVMEHRDLNESVKKDLLNTREPLRRRILAVPRAITKNPIDLDINKPPLSRLMGSLKARRDAFVHCEPGPEPSDRGHVKETLFHDVSRSVVDETVDSTIEVVRRIWFAVHQRVGPRWLPGREANGHFPGRNLQLTTGSAD